MEAPWLGKRGGTPSGGSESARAQAVGVLRPETEAAEKEKAGSASTSVEGSTKSSGLLCSLVGWRAILRFFREDVVKGELPVQLEERLYFGRLWRHWHKASWQWRQWRQ
ncbi:hypothetical protein VTH06DRAFT_3484 [Thermothelomyces fergusii]